MNHLTKVLTYAGTIPFFMGWAMTVGDVSLGFIEGTWLFHTYSTVILCFMAGTLWGQASHFASSQHNMVLGLSNLWAILPWIALLSFTGSLYWIALLTNLFGFAHIYWIEHRFKSASAPVRYYELRKRVSLIVIALHGFMIFQAFI